MLSTCLILLLACSAFGQDVPVPAAAISGIRMAAIGEINTQMNAQNTRLAEALAAFKPINISCQAALKTATSDCEKCVIGKCEARAKSVCKPEEWQIILGKTVNFFATGIPDFFSNTIPDVFVNKIGGGIVDITHDVGDFFTDTIGGGVLDIGNAIGGGVMDGVNGIIDFGNTIGDGVVDFGNLIGDGIKTGIDGIKDFGSSIGNSIGDAFESIGSIFGKREEITLEDYLRTRRNGEPSCSDFENDPNKACGTYLDAAYCPICGFTPNKDCAGYQAAADRVNAANSARSWVQKIKTQNFDITEMTFNPAKMDPTTGGFRGVKVAVNIFGSAFRFSVDESINPYIPNIAGPVIAKKALEMFKTA